MLQNDFNESINSNAAPYDQINHREFAEALSIAGSFVSMCENKKINNSTFFSLLLETPSYQEFFTEITSSNSFKEAILFLLYLQPNLLKSKITKSVLRRLNAKTKPINRPRKVTVQQTPSSVKKRAK